MLSSSEVDNTGKNGEFLEGIHETNYEHSSMTRRPQGFSLLELLLALGTMAATLLLVVALGLSVASRNQQTLETPVGALAAESILNQFVYNVQSSANPAAFFSLPTTPNYATGSQIIDKVQFTYRLDLEKITTVGTGLGGTNQLMKLTVRVVWNLGDGPNGGQHTSEMVRLLHEDS